MELMERYCSKIGKEAIDLTAVPPASVKGMPSTMWNKSPERREKGRAGDLKASQKCGCLEAQGDRDSSEVLRTHTSQLPLMTHTRWEGWTKTDEQAYLTPARVSSWRMCICCPAEGQNSERLLASCLREFPFPWCGERWGAAEASVGKMNIQPCILFINQ